MQALLKQQQEQLQTEMELRKQEQALQHDSRTARKLKSFELLPTDMRPANLESSLPASWVDPASVAEATAAASSSAATAENAPPPASQSIPTISTEEFRKRLAEWKCALDKKSRELAQQADKNLSLLGLRVNEVTGYREVELLKEAVRSRGKPFSSSALSRVVRCLSDHLSRT